MVHQPERRAVRSLASHHHDHPNSKRCHRRVGIARGTAARRIDHSAPPGSHRPGTQIRCPAHFARPVEMGYRRFHAAATLGNSGPGTSHRFANRAGRRTSRHPVRNLPCSARLHKKSQCAPIPAQSLDPLWGAHASRGHYAASRRIAFCAITEPSTFNLTP